MAYLALGSNVGPREQTLRQAVQRLRMLPRTHVQAVSRFYETEPVDAPPASGRFINAAAAVETQLSPAELMKALLEIEQLLGRDRMGGGGTAVRNAPRSIDLDLVFYGDARIDLPELTVPHPRMQHRQFVLEPLAEIAAEVRHPVSGRTVAEMLDLVKKGTNPGI